MPDRIAYKVMSPTELGQLRRDGVFRGSPVDLADGYIHLSCKAQLAETLDKHFAGIPDLILAAVDLPRLGDTVQWEPSRGGQLFPHIYGPLPIEAVVSAAPLERASDGTIKLTTPAPDPFAAFRLTGRSALVTGGRREIGRAIALGLAGAGARLAIHHAGTAEEARDAESVCQEIQAMGGQATSFAQDFTQDDAGHILARAATAWSPIDILVLNASIELPEDFRTITRDHFDRQIAVNLRTTMELLQTLVPPMAERGWGRVMTIGSVQQERPHPSMLVYAGTKAAQLNWVLSLARQYGSQGVTVNNLAPGAILTARNRDQMAIEGEALAQRIPAGRLGRPDDLVGAAMLLCSDAGTYINGANLFVDGGRTAV